jgi:putative nucleotidyltransferase with HDIG domain
MPAVESLEQEKNEKLWALRDLPPFPWIATKVLQLFGSRGDDVEIRRLIELIRADASLGSELLRRANSPLYGLRSRISSLQHAVVILGLDQVKTLSMTIGIGAYLKGALRLTVLRRCWRHSLTCAILAEELAPSCGIPADQAYTAGLLHDIGRLALLVKYPQPYADLLSVVMENRFHLAQSERDLFDVDHCEAGAWLAREWGFPEELAQAASSHHDPPEDGRFGLLRLVHVACRLASSMGFEVVQPASPEETSQVLAELPKRALTTLDGDVAALKERLTRKLNALE